MISAKQASRIPYTIGKEIGNVKKVWGVLHSILGKWLYLHLFVGLTRYTIYPLQLYLGGKLVDAIIGYFEAGSSIKIPILYGGVLGLTQIVYALLDSLYSYLIANRVSLMLSYDSIKERFIAEVYRFNLAELEKEELFNRIKLFRQFWIPRAVSFLKDLVVLGGSVISLLVTFVFLLQTWSNDMVLWLFIIVLGVLYGAFYDLYSQDKIRKTRVGLAFGQRVYDYLDTVLLDASTFLERKVNSMHVSLINKMRTIGKNIKQSLFGVYTPLDLGVVVTRVIKMSMINIARLGYLVKALLRRDPVGSISANFSLLSNVSAKVENIAVKVTVIIDHIRYLVDLFWILDYKGFAEEKNGGKHGIPVPAKQPLILEWRGLSYKLNHNRILLQNVDWVVEPYEKVFVFGEDGTGKTFMVKLLTAFFPAPDNTYFINGVPVQRLARNNVKALFSVVSDTFAKYYFSLIENVTMGDTKPFDRDLYITALKIAQLYDWAKQEGILFKDDVYLGNYFSDRALSMGYWQRIVIARAIYRDRPIFLFDMPFTYIDDKAKASIMDQLLEYVTTKKKTFIYIGEEFDFVNRFDSVYEKTPTSLVRLDDTQIKRRFRIL